MPFPPADPFSPSIHAGDKNAAIDYYSKGVAELEKGISYQVHAQGAGINTTIVDKFQGSNS